MDATTVNPARRSRGAPPSDVFWLFSVSAMSLRDSHAFVFSAAGLLPSNVVTLNRNVHSCRSRTLSPSPPVTSSTPTRPQPIRAEPDAKVLALARALARLMASGQDLIPLET
jgi:hypothetical protein